MKKNKKNALVKRDTEIIPDLKIKLAVIGVGSMGSAIVRGVINADIVKPKNITASDIDSTKLTVLSEHLNINTTTSNEEAVEGANVILFALKPHFLISALDGLRNKIKPGTLIISIAAGVTIKTIEGFLGSGTPIIRAMPNTPCQVGAGAIGFARNNASQDKDAQLANTLFNALGLSIEVPEDLLDAVTGLSGSGPAYVFVMIEAMTDAGVRVGLPRHAALKLAAQTVFGSAKMLLDTNGHPACLKDAVTSPGGTTIAGIDKLESAGFRSAIIEAVKAATERSKELS